MTLPAPILPDVLAPEMRLVFCGTALGAASARAQAYYAGPGNRFWATIHEVGLTPILLLPVEYAWLAEFGIGLTDMSKTASGSDREVGRNGFDPGRLAATIEALRPANLAFNGKNSAKAALGGGSARYGRQSGRIGGARVWVLPSTSGAARGFWDIGPWRELAGVAGSADC